MIANVSILLLSTLCITYAGLNLYALVRADSLIFPVPTPSYEDNEAILKLSSSTGDLISAYYLEAKNSQRLLLYSHGNGEDIGSAKPFLEMFKQRGISVLAYDYPGYGTSSGAPTEAGCYAAIQAAYDYTTKELNYSPDQIVLYGRSLGSGPSTWLAAKQPTSGVILDGAFTSTFRVLTNVKLLTWDRFDNLARLPKIQQPFLLIHGTEDSVVPFTHAQKNWDAIQGPKFRLFVEGARHGNAIDIAGQTYWKSIIAFIHGELK